MEDRQYFTAQIGLPSPWRERRETPLSHSFCQYVKRAENVLIVENARVHADLKTNLAVRDFDVVAYLGVPIRAPGGAVIGALCVIDTEPRAWSAQDAARLSDLALCVNDEIKLRAAAMRTEALYRDLETAHGRLKRISMLRDTISQVFMVPDLTLEARFQEMLRAACKALDMESGSIACFNGGMPEILFHHPVDHTVVRLVEKAWMFTDEVTYLANRVLSGEQQVMLRPAQDGRTPAQVTLTGEHAKTYAAAPLILNGVMFGVIEFANIKRSADWSEEFAETLTMIALFTCAYLSAYEQICLLKGTSSTAAPSAPRKRAKVTSI